MTMVDAVKNCWETECPCKRDDGNSAMVVSPYKIWLWELGICRTAYGEIVRGGDEKFEKGGT